MSFHPLRTAAIAMTVVTAILVATPLPAQKAMARKEIGRTSVGTPTPVFLEPRTVSREGTVITAAIRVALVPPLKHPKGELKSSRTVGMYNCATKTVATKESWYYLNDAGTSEGMHRQVKIPGFGPVGKGSVAEVALTYLCANTK
ncbi:surface-adhesin E family protein [Gemmatimonas phototrophica]|nr:surface-adhesin E family protein [Gemmatimonas phototrophica]